jgi:catechol 2,3-dioxygenase-like lactoylglutathione lyase family enzyme
MLKNGNVAARLPAQDLKRAKAFYADKLDLTPAKRGRAGFATNVEAALSHYSNRPALHRGRIPKLAWEVDNIESTVAELRARGVVFDEYDLPGLTTVNGIAEVAGNYPSCGGIGEKPRGPATGEGNILGIGQPVR